MQLRDVFSDFLNICKYAKVQAMSLVWQPIWNVDGLAKNVFISKTKMNNLLLLEIKKIQFNFELLIKGIFMTLMLQLHWQKSSENLEKKTKIPQLSQNDNIFVKMCE